MNKLYSVGYIQGKKVNYKEFTIYSSDRETVFIEIEGEGIKKVAEWVLVSDTKMEYTRYNDDGSVNTHYVHEGNDIKYLWEKYHQKTVGMVGEK